MKNICKGWVYLLIFSMAFFGTAIADEPSSEDTTEMEELTVIGNRDLLSLRGQIRAAEVRMFEVFNEINDDDDYDIVCRMQAPLGTRIKNQVCSPVYYFKAHADHGQETLAEIQGQASYRGPYVTSVIGHHNHILRDKLAEAVKESPELLDAIMEFRGLVTEYREKHSDYHNE